MNTDRCGQDGADCRACAAYRAPAGHCRNRPCRRQPRSCRAQDAYAGGELRAFVAARSTPQTRPRIRALLAGYGVAKLTDLPESDYLDLMREVEAL